MAREKRIVVAPDSEVAAVLEEAAETASAVEVSGAVYRVTLVDRNGQEKDLWAGYDADKIRNAVAETAGSWSDLDVDAMIDEIYRARSEVSRPASRP